MPEMITVRCPQCGKKLLFSPFDNYKKATLECPGCHYTGLVETYPEIQGAQQPQDNRPQAQQTPAAASGAAPASRPRNQRSQNNGGIRDLDGANPGSSSESTSRSQYRSPRSSSNSRNEDQPSGFALKFPWVITALAVTIIILYVCLQCISTNEVI